MLEVPSRPVVLRFVATVLLSLVVLLSPWPGLGSRFCVTFCGWVDLLGLDEGAPGRTVNVAPALAADAGNGVLSDWHALVTESPARDLPAILGTSAARGGFAFNTRASVYVPLAVFLAFSAGFRIWQKSRGAIAFAWGLAATLAYGVAAFRLSLAHFGRPARTEPGLVDLVTDSVFFSLIVPPGMSLAIPAAIALVTTLAVRRAEPREIADGSRQGVPVTTKSRIRSKKRKQRLVSR
jgi:hypothetical protein